MLGKANTFATCREGDTSRRKGGGWGKGGNRGEYENISHAVCCAPRRAGGVNGTKGVYGEL